MIKPDEKTLYDLMKDYPRLKKEPTILILGLDNAGKTTLLNYLTHEKTRIQNQQKEYMENNFNFMELL